MRSQLVFIMHPADEIKFTDLILSEPGTVFVNGPRWSSSTPPTTTEIHGSGDYLMIWHPSEAPGLSGRHYQKEETEWWYCENEFLTVQFLRSGFQFGETYLFGGRIAITTTNIDKAILDEPSAHLVEARFKKLSKAIKKIHKNKLIIWQDPSSPRSGTNPIKPDATVWVGPHALKWLEEDPNNRWVQPFRGAGAKGYLLDLVN
jgi:hypothetical protein